MAAITKVLIGRMALSHVGARTNIENFDEDTAEANELDLWYDHCRKQALEGNDWNFARKRQTLALHADEAPDPWRFRYIYPADALVLRKIVNPLSSTANAIPFQVETSEDGTQKSILTDVDDACAIYTFDQPDTQVYSRFFIDLLSRLIASYIAFKLTGKTSVAEKNGQQYAIMLRNAPAHNANEAVGRPPRDADWVRNREGDFDDAGGEDWRAFAQGQV